MATRKREPRYVVVCTDKRGVFAGVLESGGLGEAVLTEVRNCIYWSKDVGGVLGLSASGPSASCRIGAASPRLTLNGVHAVMDCSQEARAAWIAAPVYK